MTLPPTPTRRLGVWRRRLWGLLGVTMVPAVALCGYILGEQREAARQAELPVLGSAPAYVLTNQLGQRVSSDSFRGKVQFVTFLFPYCTTMCPLIAAHLANFEHLGIEPAGMANAVQLVSFNLDPADTGPIQMREFLRQYGWDPADAHWQYLTGAAGEIHRVVRDGYGIGYQRVPLTEEGKNPGRGVPVVQPEVANALAEHAHVDYDIIHNDVLEVVDRQGRVRKIFDDADTVDWHELLRVAASLGGRPS